MTSPGRRCSDREHHESHGNNLRPVQNCKLREVVEDDVLGRAC